MLRTKIDGGNLFAISVYSLMAISLAVSLWGFSTDTYGLGWKRVGGLRDGLKTHFIVIDKKMISNRSTYYDAIKHVCKEEICVSIFWENPADVPETRSSKEYYSDENYQNTVRSASDKKILATYWSNQNTSFKQLLWNCNLLPATPKDDCIVQLPN